MREHRRGDEDRRVSARRHADKQREAEVLERLTAERKQRDDRQQRGQGRGEGSRKHLGHRAVDDLGERGPRHPRHVLAYSVEHDDRVVKRETEDGQERRHGVRGDLALEQRVHARGDQQVVRQRDQNRHGELELESQTYVERDQNERRDDRDQRGLGDLSAEGRPHGVRRELRAHHPELLVERLLHRVHLVRRQLLHGDLEDVLAELFVLDLLDLRIAIAERRDRVAHVLHASGPLYWRGDARAGLEVDAEVHAEAGDGDRPGGDDRARHGKEPFRLAHEVEVPPDALLAGGQSVVRAQDARARQRSQERRGEQHRGEQRHERPHEEREREALHRARGEHEEDEGDADRDDVRVDDRFESLAVALGDRARNRGAGAHLFLYSLEDDDVGVRRHAEREDHARDARQRERDRDQLDHRIQQDRVDEESEGRHQAEHAVEAEQEDQREHEAHRAGDEALVERLLAERRGHLGLRDQLEVDREGADAQVLRQVVGLLDRADVVDLGARAAVDAARVVAEVHCGERDDLVVERDRKALIGVGGRGAGRQELRRSALGDALGGARELAAPEAAEGEGDVGSAGLVGLLLGVLDVGARQRRVVLHHEVAGRRRAGLRAGGGRRADDYDALRHLENLAALRRAGGAERLQLGAALRVLHHRARSGLSASPEPVRVVREQLLAARCRLPVLERPRVRALLQGRCEEVVLVARGVVLVVVVLLDQVLVAVELFDHRLVRAARRDVRGLRSRQGQRPALYRLEEAEDRAVRGVVGGSRVRVHQLVRPLVDVGLPVVELELRGAAHLLLGPRDVLHVREADRDLIVRGALDLRLGHTQGVGALADRGDRLVDRGRRDLRHLRRGLALVDELDAALEVEAEARGLARDDEHRGRDQRQHHEQYEPVAPGARHRLRTSG